MMMHVMMVMQQDLIKYKGFFYDFSRQSKNVKLWFLEMSKVMNSKPFEEIFGALERGDNGE